MIRIKTTLTALLCACCTAYSAETEDDGNGRLNLADGMEYGIEAQTTLSDGKTPLWLNANRYGLSSIESSNGYIRAGVFRKLGTDSLRRWGVGYGVDLAAAYNFTSSFVVQQAFVEGRWLHGTLSVGSKQYPMELKNNSLSSGSQTLGINARPVPQVRIALPEYWTVPLTNGWLHLKGHIAYGRMTDDNWQHDFTSRKSKYSDNVLYHSKAGYLKIGKDNSFGSFSLELGLEMAATFGGNSHYMDNSGNMIEVKGNAGLKAYWDAFIPGGADPGETTYKNVSGNQTGSWLIRMNWDEDLWRFSLYADKYFEDHSAMFQLDYDGYGSGEEWQKKKKRRFLLYDFKDWMLGAELNLKYGRWVRNIVFEYVYTKYQSGPIYHDHTSTIPDHIGGNDDFYNHYIYTGWQHWGQVIGNPLYRSPIYNTDGTIMVKDNRFVAFHLGIDGQPADNFSYRMLASWQQGLGTYKEPFLKTRDNLSVMVEGRYAFSCKALKGWSVKGSYGMDLGSIIGNNYGFQLTVTKTGLIKF